MYFDSHCHLDFPSLPDGALERAVRAGVDTVLVPGVDLAQRARMDALIVRDGLRVLRSAGAHPAVGRAGLEGLRGWLEAHPGAAVGEFGWDRHVRISLQEQDDVAEQQLRLAAALERPVILHVVGRHGHALDRLAPHAPLHGVVHAYSGSAELVPRYLALGLSISFGLSITRPSARRVREAARAVPDGRLLIETDGPDQHRLGETRGEPADVVRVAEALAEVRGVDLAQVAERTRDNAWALFGGEGLRDP
ncbi:MAG: TatD family hydrolase [Sandaracinaceae bacterium]